MDRRSTRCWAAGVLFGGWLCAFELEAQAAPAPSEPGPSAPAQPPKPDAPQPSAAGMPQDPPSTDAPAAAAPGEGAPAVSEPAPEVADAPVVDHPELDPALELPPSSAGVAATRKELLAELARIEAEQREASNLLPWIALGTGGAMALLGASIGAYNAFDCDLEPACEGPAWATLVTVLGGAVGVLSAIWLVHTDRGIAELEHKRHNLELRLLDARSSSWRRRDGAGRTGLRIGVAF